MAKKVAVMAFNPVNGLGLFQYLEAFFENGIPYRTFAVADKTQIKTNSETTLFVDDVIANLRGHEDEYDALVFSCGDAIIHLSENMEEPWNRDMMAVVKAFADKDKIMIGHCAAGMIYDMAGVGAGRRIALHPYAKTAVSHVHGTDEKKEVDGNFYTAQTENSLYLLIPEIVEALK
ncbi:DJ-1/PfpI family protein [Alistipes sp. OttesenSCG-928-B03]|nr:DJ-1/PfpI family protein [Alistipes sp. OttesenSCG-928-B03]